MTPVLRSVAIPEELHPELTAAERRALVVHGVELFNAGRFYDAHEAWEAVWRSTTPEPRDLFQGLIQVTVGLHHYVDRGKPGPASRVLARGIARLEPFPRRTLGVDLGALVDAARAWEAWLRAGDGEPPPHPAIEIVEPAALE